MFENLTEIIKNNRDFIITSHVNPDGDSIGSELALYRYLKKMDKNASIINYSPLPENYKFLDSEEIIEKYEANLHDAIIMNSEVIFILDTNEYSRLRTMENIIKKSYACKVCIDHHLGNNKNGFDYYVNDTESPATGEILYKFFSESGIPISYEIAVPLYTAIMTDTGSFRFHRTDSETHHIAAELIDLGVNPELIFSQVYHTSSREKIQLLSRFLNSITLAENNTICYGIVSLNDFRETGTNVMDTDGFSHVLMSISTVKIGFLITESPHGLKISFRSKDSLDVTKLANIFGGGGHRNAAGAWIENIKTEELITQIIDQGKRILNQENK